MVKSIGIDPGDQTVKVVELDGSYRKTRLVRVHTAPVDAAGAVDGTARSELVAAAVKAAIGDGMRGELTLGHPCREAVLRFIELPFKGHDAIRKVVKSEIEGEIHSHVVDDMVVDFHEIGEGSDGGTRVMVASVPKAGLRSQLSALTAQSIEVETVDLDTMALWRVAHWAGAFTREPVEGQVPVGTPPVTAVVDLGARSVRVILVEGEQLVEMRALRLGDHVVTDEIARQHGIDAEPARAAVLACLLTGTDQRIEVADVLLAVVAGEETPALQPEPTLRKITISRKDVEAAHTAYLQRLARELARYLTASGRAARSSALWLTGGASRSPGVKEMLAEVFGVEPRELDVLAKLQHDLDPERAAELRSRLATAVGLALSRFGGPEGFNLRQEDLVLARGFDRIKFPLAITCMVGLLAMFVYGIKLAGELRNLELQIGSTYIDKKNSNAPPQFFGMLNEVLHSGWFEKPDYFRYEQSKGKDYTYKQLVAELIETPEAKRIQLVKDKLSLVADQKQKESGVYEDVSLESGFAVLVRWAGLLKSVEPQLKRYLVTRIDLTMKGNRKLDFQVAFRGEDFRERESALVQAIEAEYNKPDSPFERPAARSAGTPEELFKDTGGDSGVIGAYYKFSMPIKGAFEPFGPSTAHTIGAAPPVRPPIDVGNRLTSAPPKAPANSDAATNVVQASANAAAGEERR
ncbi:MAG: pilus assembly protein PilM [Planctomycetota bacterium]